MQSVLMVFAHPDDVACGMGGLASLLKGRFDLHCVCATRGERGLQGRNLAETGALREREQRKESELLGAELTFLGRIDRELFADAETCRQVADIVRRTQPRALFTVWPIDHHPDHSAVSEIARKALFMAQQPVEIVYCEEDDSQTALFTPSTYVDITGVMDGKLELVRSHACQNPDDSLAQRCLRKAARRGAECGCAYAEGYRSISDPRSGEPSVLSAIEPANSPCPRVSSASVKGRAGAPFSKRRGSRRAEQR